MHNVFTQAFSNLAVVSALFVTLISSVVRAHQQCGQEDLVRCAQPLQVLTDAGLTLAASKKDLDIICPDLRAGLRCVHSYTRRCMNLQQRAHFNKLFHGTNSMVKELCQNGTYQEEYLKYAPCMRKVVDQNEICFKRYQATMESISRRQNREPQAATPPHPDLPHHHETVASETGSTDYPIEHEDDGIRSVCCSFQEYVECSTHTIRRACDEDAVRFSRGFLDRMASSMIKLHCSEYIHAHGKCGYSSSDRLSVSFLTILSSSLFLVLFAIVR